ncbi:MAG: hypothetical protein LBQ08_02730 [Holosporaceae bacterium]|jgi:hypothetical protein|nr:hypothetical protein [Holosporaceae bacterium]
MKINRLLLVIVVFFSKTASGMFADLTESQVFVTNQVRNHLEGIKELILERAEKLPIQGSMEQRILEEEGLTFQEFMEQKKHEINEKLERLNGISAGNFVETMGAFAGTLISAINIEDPETLRFWRESGAPVSWDTLIESCMSKRAFGSLEGILNAAGERPPHRSLFEGLLFCPPDIQSRQELDHYIQSLEQPIQILIAHGENPNEFLLYGGWERVSFIGTLLDKILWSIATLREENFGLQWKNIQHYFLASLGNILISKGAQTFQQRYGLDPVVVDCNFMELDEEWNIPNLLEGYLRNEGIIMPLQVSDTQTQRQL